MYSPSIVSPSHTDTASPPETVPRSGSKSSAPVTIEKSGTSRLLSPSVSKRTATRGFPRLIHQFGANGTILPVRGQAMVRAKRYETTRSLGSPRGKYGRRRSRSRSQSTRPSLSISAVSSAPQRDGISRVARRIAAATGFSSFAVALMPKRMASNGIDPPPAVGSIIPIGVLQVASRSVAIRPWS